MEKQMIGELNIRRSLEDVIQGIRRTFYEKSKTGSLELEVPFERLHLPGHGKFSRHANVTLGKRKERFDGATLIPLEWSDAESSPNFPKFEGYFEILPLDPDVSQVAIVGDYAPPLVRSGRRSTRPSGGASQKRRLKSSSNVCGQRSKERADRLRRARSSPPGVISA